MTIYPSEGVFAIASPTAIVKGGPHPNAAKLFAAFMIGDSVQNAFAQEGIYAARIDAPAPSGSPALQSLKLMPIDFAALAQDEGSVKSRFNEIFSIGRRACGGRETANENAGETWHDRGE